jgi:hypothetical protein
VICRSSDYVREDKILFTVTAVITSIPTRETKFTFFWTLVFPVCCGNEYLKYSSKQIIVSSDKVLTHSLKRKIYPRVSLSFNLLLCSRDSFSGVQNFPILCFCCSESGLCTFVHSFCSTFPPPTLHQLFHCGYLFRRQPFAYKRSHSITSSHSCKWLSPTIQSISQSFWWLHFALQDHQDGEGRSKPILLLCLWSEPNLGHGCCY